MRRIDRIKRVGDDTQVQRAGLAWVAPARQRQGGEVEAQEEAAFAALPKGEWQVARAAVDTVA